MFASDIVSLTWSPDGEHFTHVARRNDTTDLVRVNARSGQAEVMVHGEELVPPGETAPISIEGYTFSTDLRDLLIYTNSVRVWRQNTKGEYYVWNFASRRLTPASTRPGYQQFAKLSPDGRKVAFVRENNLFVTDLVTGAEVQLTKDGSENVINGTSDWVYEEELGLRDAFRWSPDGSRLAFWRIDQTVIKPFYMIDESSLYSEPIPVRYPKAGEQNSEVKIGVVDVASGATVWIDLGHDKDIYIAEMGFVDEHEVWLTRLNRHQNMLDLMLGDVTSGESRVIMTDTDAAWVDAQTPLWIDGGSRYLFQSERSGFNHLYLFNRDGTLKWAVTQGDWEVTSFYGIDDEREVLYIGTTKDSPLRRTLYRVNLDGSSLERISSSEGSHRIQFNSTFSMYVDRYSSAGSPPQQTLNAADGSVINVIRDNAELRARIDTLDLNPPEFMTVPGAAGDELNAYMIKPRDFDPSRSYPVLMYVYGGPGSQTVADSWGGTRYLWHQLLVERGILVVSVDNRGTGARGRDFKKQTYLNLGRLESDDQIAAAEHFGQLSYVDADRIGIWGWSYGGYMSSLTLLRGADAFKAAVAVAPVTDWRLYDTIYTERYMRTPQENPEGYTFGAPVTHAAKLEGDLLVIHGTGDDNVHSQNTTQLIQALEEANKQFDMRMYPNKTHSIAGGITRVNLYTYMTDWIVEKLGVGALVP